MDLASLSPIQIKELVKLVEQKQSLLTQIEALDAKLSNLGDGTLSSDPLTQKAVASKAKKSVPKKARASKIKRGGLKEVILSALKDAPTEGMSVADIAKKAGTKLSSVNVWLYTTGKSTPEIQKVGRGRYTFRTLSPEGAPA